MKVCSVRESEAEHQCGLDLFTVLTVNYEFDGQANGRTFAFQIPMCEAHYNAFTASLGDLSAYAVGLDPA